MLVWSEQGKHALWHVSDAMQIGMQGGMVVHSSPSWPIKLQVCFSFLGLGQSRAQCLPRGSLSSFISVVPFNSLVGCGTTFALIHLFVSLSGL